MTQPRHSGVLLHPTSLPGGRLGDEAYRFVDWLQAAGQAWWQILPVGPPDETGSPYKAASAFAGWKGLLAEPDAPVSGEELERFVAQHAYWIAGWAAYAGDAAIADQVRFTREWTALRDYAEQRGVRLIGDLPIYVAPDGADHLSHFELFQNGLVAGVPPDDWSATGQLWGNPLYDWYVMRATGFRWWIERFRRTFELVDVARVDHFRGFVAYWAVPARNTTARVGAWHRAPGRELFAAVNHALGGLPLIAEDLGLITEPVKRLRDELRVPGMVVLQFSFSEGLKNPQQATGSRRASVIYTGTHDNPTTAQWWQEATDKERDNACRAFVAADINAEEPTWAMIELALASPSRLAIVPAQDLLGLGAEARMNTPGRQDGNWNWQLSDGQLTDELAQRLRAATERTGRVQTPMSPRSLRNR
jgi:4-alpha-glucanotransferase